MTEPPKESTDARRTRPFADVLTSLRRGKTHRELSDAMQELSLAVIETHRAGTITLTIKVSKSKASGMVEIDDTVKVKLPEPDRSSSMFFVTDDGNLSKDDPRQLSLDVGPVRVVDDSYTEAGNQ